MKLNGRAIFSFSIRLRVRLNGGKDFESVDDAENICACCADDN